MGGGGGWGNFLYMAWYGCACRMAPFFSTARYMIGSHFSTKSIWLTPFFLIGIWKTPLFSDIPVFAHIFHPQIFEAACSLVIQWVDYLSNYQQLMGTKNQQAVYEWVIVSDDLVYEWVHFFKGQVYEWGRFRNTVLHTRTKITPKLPPNSQICWFLYCHKTIKTVFTCLSITLNHFLTLPFWVSYAKVSTLVWYFLACLYDLNNVQEKVFGTPHFLHQQCCCQH